MFLEPGCNDARVCLFQAVLGKTRPVLREAVLDVTCLRSCVLREQSMCYVCYVLDMMAKSLMY